jgi:uncharacterized protein YkwD
LDLESRNLLSGVGVGPSDYEEYMITQINQVRADPAAEAVKLENLIQTDPTIASAAAGWDLAPVIALLDQTAPLPPLALNTRLVDAAHVEDARMVAANAQIHSPSDFLIDAQVAADSDGKAFLDVGTGAWATGENIFAYSGNVPATSMQAYVDYLEAGFLIDWGNPDLGHLRNILAPGPGEATADGHVPFNQVGVGILAASPTTAPGANPEEPGNTGLNVGPVLAAQEFGWTAGSAFLTGVAYTDQANAGTYEPGGEGLGGVTITAIGLQGQGTFSTQSYSSGGYSLALPTGSYSVTASGGGLTTPRSTTVTIGVDNVGWDLVNPAVPSPTPTPAPSPTPIASTPTPTASNATTTEAASSASEVTASTGHRVVRHVAPKRHLPVRKRH